MQAAMDALFSVATAALIIRWAHVIFGIIWMGHLYFFNLVNVPFQGGLDKELKPKVNPALLLRAFWWFRWAAMYTFIFGWLLFFWHYMGPEHYLVDQTTGGATSGVSQTVDSTVQTVVDTADSATNDIVSKLGL